LNLNLCPNQARYLITDKAQTDNELKTDDKTLENTIPAEMHSKVQASMSR
jgi:hypothetical protein